MIFEDLVFLKTAVILWGCSTIALYFYKYLSGGYNE